ncbi:50S ribosomal protein L19 [Candidatus Aerophobetes bacterium]|nr:50S ribosomal protein L19 [Candidatus Aerophobetes bacterium]
MDSEIKEIEERFKRNELPDFRPGDTVAVHFAFKEGDRERIQIFEGVVLEKKGGGIRKTFTVRKISFGIGVERTFPLHSPLIKKIDVIKKGRARRANLTYLRIKTRR